MSCSPAISGKIEARKRTNKKNDTKPAIITVKMAIAIVAVAAAMNRRSKHFKLLFFWLIPTKNATTAAAAAQRTAAATHSFSFIEAEKPN